MKQFSHPFSVRNGVRQSGVLSPILLTNYNMWMTFSLAWGILLLAVTGGRFLLTLSGLQMTWLFLPQHPQPFTSCFTFVRILPSHGLQFNPSKTQLICFGHSKASLCIGLFVFCGTKLSFFDSVTHFGHILCYDLSDMRDILRSTHVFIKNANCMLCTFSTANFLA